MHDHLPRRLKQPIGSRRLVLVLIALAVALYRYYFAAPPSASPLPRDPESAQPESRTDAPAPANQHPVERVRCQGRAGCLEGTVASVIDGDTLNITHAGGASRIRLVLVDAPERDTAQGPAATQQLTRICAPGAPAVALADAKRPRDDYGRTLALVWCGTSDASAAGNIDQLPSANEKMIRSGSAELYRRFCRSSSFGNEPWARELGCR